MDAEQREVARGEVADLDDHLDDRRVDIAAEVVGVPNEVKRDLLDHGGEHRNATLKYSYI